MSNLEILWCILVVAWSLGNQWMGDPSLGKMWTTQLLLAFGGLCNSLVSL